MPVTHILEPEGYSEEALSCYRKLGHLFFGSISLDEKCLVSILVVRLNFKISSSFLSGYTSLDFILSPTTALSHIDLAYCNSRNIRIISLRDCGDDLDQITSTSELSIGLLFSIYRHIFCASRNSIYSLEWNRDLYKSRQLSSQVMGILGLGRIGTHVAKFARSFNMRVIGYDPYRSNDYFLSRQVRPVALLELAEYSDIIMIHASLTPETIGLIGREFISSLQRFPFIVNTARGELVDSLSMANAVRSGLVSGFAADVLEDELELSKRAINPLMVAAKDGFNIVITPHIGGCCSDAMGITEKIIANYFLRIHFPETLC